MDEADSILIEVNEDRCSKCGLCYSICPFEAILVEENTGRLRIDTEQCQLCGICVSIRPSLSIEIAYYNYNSLVSYVKEQAEALQTKTLVIMCRGSSPPSCEMADVLKEQSVSEFIPLRVPCVGRLDPQFYLKALTLGINKIIAIQCDEDSCRFKKGSEINTRKVKGLQILLEQLEYGGDTLTLIKNTQKAVYDTEKCVGCDKCEYTCPYGAIEVLPFATPQINFDECKGCGACALVCPHLAMQIKNFEYETIFQKVEGYKSKVEELKVKGVSPLTLVFCCQWAEFPALDNRRDGFFRENIAIVEEVPCFNGLDPAYVLQASRSAKAEIDYVKSMGAEIKLNSVVGRLMTVDELLKDGYNAVFIGIGAGAPMFLNIPGENLKGIYSANEFLVRVNLMKAYLFPEYDTPLKIGKKVAVIGAGNVAMDGARWALRLGADEVHIVYRRGRAEMPARIEELENAEEEGIIFDFLTKPKQFLGDEHGWVKGMECYRMEFGEPDKSGRRRPVHMPGSEFIMEIDTAIPALGTLPNPLLPRSTPGLETTRWGTIVADEETGRTIKDRVWAGGDITTGAATVITAMGAGKRAAADIDAFLKS